MGGRVGYNVTWKYGYICVNRRMGRWDVLRGMTWSLVQGRGGTIRWDWEAWYQVEV